MIFGRTRKKYLIFDMRSIFIFSEIMIFSSHAALHVACNSLFGIFLLARDNAFEYVVTK